MLCHIGKECLEGQLLHHTSNVHDVFRKAISYLKVEHMSQTEGEYQ